MLSIVLNCSKQGAIPLCEEVHEIESYYQPLVSCISQTIGKRWIPIQNKSTGFHLSKSELEVHGKYFSFTVLFFTCAILFSYCCVWVCVLIHIFAACIPSKYIETCYLNRNSAWRFLRRSACFKINSKKLLVFAFTLDFLRPPKETRRWRSLTSIQHDPQCHGHECSLWGLKCCIFGGKKINLGDECCSCQGSKYSSTHLRSGFCWCFAWLVWWFNPCLKFMWLCWHFRLSFSILNIIF